MIHPALSSRISWSQRVIVALAAAVIVGALLPLVIGFNPLDRFFADPSPPEGWIYSAGLGFALLGAAVVGVERGFRRAAWLALPVFLLGLAALLLPFPGAGRGLEPRVTELFSAETVANDRAMPAVIALALMLAGGAVAGLLSPRPRPGRTLGFVLAGSLLASVGVITLLGDALNLPAASRWGAGDRLPPGVALVLFLAGLLLLAMASRAHRVARPGAPRWLPLPLVILCGLLTVVLWNGLREQETVYLGTAGQLAINGFASAINLEFEEQCAGLERVGRRWTAGEEASVWDADAALWRIDAPGAVSLARVAPDGITTWCWPIEGNETLIGLDQFEQPARRRALDQAAREGKPAVTGSIDLAGRGPGFAIYAPLYRDRALVGFVGAEFPYQRFFENIDRRRKITVNHRCEIMVGDQRAYDSVPGLAGLENRPLALASVFTVQDRRLRIIMEPTPDYLRQNRGYLPEIALAAGFGITLLLGLSVHLARNARAGLAAAETSNRLLREENERRHRIETMLKVSDERLRLSLDATSISIFEWYIPAGVIRHGVGLPAKFGLPPAESLATPEAWKARIHPDDLPDFLAAFRRQHSGAEDFIDPEYRMRTVDGAWRWFYTRAKTVAYDDSGAPSRIVGTLQDITSRKESEQALRRSQAAARKLSLVASRTDNLVLIGTPDGAIEWVNESFERVMEYPLAEIVGRKSFDYMAGTATDPATLDRIRQAIAGGEVLSTEVVSHSKSGRKYHLQLEIQPVRNEHGALENFIAGEADITTRVETENALRHAKTEADAASRAKSDFLASMSHEIRTPMNGVIGMTSLLLDTPLTPGQRDFVGTIRSSGEALLSIINDILDFSKIESGKLELESRTFDLVGSIEETLDLFAVQAASHRIELAYAIDPGVPLRLVGDANRLRQVLANLVNNAIKFTPGGGVSIEVSPAQETGGLALGHGRHALAIAVRDTGIGIAGDRLDRLFKPFSQVDSSITRKYGGTGLGLAICQRLCALMGGSVRVHSEIGVGSAFTVTLPFETAADPAARPALPPALAKGFVVCADDNPVSLRRFTAFFRDAGIETLAAPTAEALLEILQKTAVPVALLLDLALPATSAGEAATALIARHKIPVVGLLPYAQAPLPPWTDAPPFTVVAKPLRTAALVRALETLFPGDTPAPAAGKETAALDLAQEFPLAVLVAEDNPVNQKVALRFLERLGYQADAVADGAAAVRAAAARPYDLIFMDLQMPEMDGMEATRLIRRDTPAGRRPCIVALTANAMPSDRDRCLESGMDGFITKPVKPGEIVDFIRSHFGEKTRGT